MVKAIIRALLSNPVLANILMVFIIISGWLGAMMMNREVFPKFSRDQVTVSVPYPGSDPSEVEESICLKLEEALEGIEGVDELTTLAKEGQGTAILSCTDNADIDKVKDDVKSLVDAITTFPTDAEKPVVQESKFRGNVLNIAVWGDASERQLKELARKLEQELLASYDCISQVVVSGIRNYEISIEVSEAALRRYELTFNDIARAIADNGMNLPAGSIKTNDEDFRIRAIGRRYRAKEYQDIPIIVTGDGTTVTLGQVARVRDAFDEDTENYALFNGQPCVTIDVYKTEDEDSITIATAVDEFIKRKEKELPDNIHLTKFADNSRFITDRLNMLMDNGLIGLCLVFFSLWLFLDIRLSFWVSMGIPISLAGGLAIMALSGCTINMLSMFGLIMVLGIIVDDAIVVGESIYARRQFGEEPFKAAVNGTAEVALPVVAAVLTTIIAFIPLFFVRGIMGKFIRQIPVPVVTALTVSLLEGLFILPVHLRHLPKPGSWKPRFVLFRVPAMVRGVVSGALDWFINKIYGPSLHVILHWRYVALCVGIVVLMVMGGLIKGGVIKFVFFPESDDDFIISRIELAPGTPVPVTRKVTDQVLKAWREVEQKYQGQLPVDKKLSQAIYSLVGSDFSFRRGAPRGSTNQLVVIIELLPTEERNIYYMDLLDEWQKRVGLIPGAVATSFTKTRRGPGGSPLELRLIGEDMDVLLKAGDELMAKLNAIDGVFDAQTNYRPGKREFLIKIKPEAHHHGITLSDIAYHLKNGFYGNEAARIQRGRDDIKVKIRYPAKASRDSIEFFENLRIRTASGKQLPIKQLATIKMAEGQTMIRRENRKKSIRVSADVNNAKANAQEILKSLEESYLPEFIRKYDINYTTKGRAEERRKSIGSLGKVGFPLALFGIFLIMASLFRSYVQPMIIMTTIPFGIIGAIIGHVIFGLPITMMSMFGIVALAGIVINDAIVLIEGINLRLAGGMSFFDSVVEGGKRRFRAILLTTITTFFGLMPLILAKSIQAQFLIPMAISIAFGVLFGTVITLILIPCFFTILNDFRCWVYLMKKLALPCREKVEPRFRPVESEQVDLNAITIPSQEPHNNSIKVTG